MTIWKVRSIFKIAGWLYEGRTAKGIDIIRSLIGAEWLYG